MQKSYAENETFLSAIYNDNDKDIIGNNEIIIKY